MLLEERRYEPDPDFARQANAQPGIYERDWEEFWETEGRERVTWFEPFSKLYEWEPPYAKWYLGGKLNVCFNCVDRHVDAGKGDKVAYYWEGEPEDERRTITFADLAARRRPLRERAQGAGREERDAGRDLHEHGPGAPDRHAGVRAPRRAAHGRVRRLLLRSAVGPAQRHGVRAPDHAGRGMARRQEGAAQTQRGRSRRSVTQGAEGRRASPHRRRGRVRRSARRLVARAHRGQERRPGLRSL